MIAEGSGSMMLNEMRGREKRLWIEALHTSLCEAYREYPQIDTFCLDAIRRCEHDRCDALLQVWDRVLGDGGTMWRRQDGDAHPG